MRKLLLTSNGFSEDINIEFFKLIGKKPSQIKIGFIPTASDVEDNKSYVQEDLDTIDELGISYAIIDLKNETKKSLYDKLSKVDVIMI